MPIVDSRSLTSGGIPLDCDVCIIGSGPAGNTIARELSGTRLRVIILESGGFERQPQADALNEIDSVGWPRVADQWLVRNRIVGGSSHSWTGRCAAFDELDFHSRNWVPHSGWPFALNDLTPYLDRSAAYVGLGVGSGFSDDRFWDIAGHKKPADLSETLLPFFWQYSRDTTNPYDYMRFGRHLPSGHNVTLVTNATVLRIITENDGAVKAVRSVQFGGVDGQIYSLTAATVVVCTGAIENARLLLASGLGNDLVGRFLMDHPRGIVARFGGETDARALLSRFGAYKARGHGNHLFQSGMRLSPDVQRDEHLLNCAAWISETIADDDPWHALKRFLRGKADLRGDSWTIFSNAGLFARGLKDYFILRRGLPRKREGLSLDCMVEQRPDPDSRVTLSDRRDRFDMCLPRLDWRMHEDEARSMRRIAELACAQFAQMQLPVPVLEEWVRDGGMFPASFTDIAHPTGTTRMSADPSQGVVDPDCEVHGIRGLFVAGSSIFPTAGHCNPTQMIVALALRLADTLKARELDTISIQSNTPNATLQRVLVTGGTGNIGRHVIDELVNRGYAVRAITSRPIAHQEHADKVEWLQFDFQTSLDFDPILQGCVAVLHLAAELGDPSRMQRINVDATRALAEAGERAGIKVFCYTSSAAVYGSALGQRVITEDSPVLTADRDVRHEYWATNTVRCYGRTKLLGERMLREVAQNVEYIVFRPTMVVDIPDLIALGGWSQIRKYLAAERHAHHIYVRDVADALLWVMERGLTRGYPVAGVTAFNLSDDDFSENTYGDFFKQAYAAGHNRAFRVRGFPWQVDYLRAVVQNHSLPLRHPFGRMIFSSRRLQATGYVFRFGMANALAITMQKLGS